MKSISVLLIAITLAAISVIYQSSPDIQSPPQMAQAVLRVRVSDGVGSGVIIGRLGGKIVVLTAAHVVLGADKSKIVVEQNGWSSPAEVTRISVESDLALLEAPAAGLPDNPIAVLCPSNPAEGSRVYAVGYPAGKSPLITIGYAGLPFRQDFTDPKRTISGFWETAQVFPGSSGGAIFQPQGFGYCVVGITSQVYVDSTFGLPAIVPFMGIAVGADEIHRWMKS